MRARPPTHADQIFRLHALSSQAKSSRRGITLLELILALAISVLVMAVISMAIDVHLRSLDSGRSQVEEAQIARAVLKMIATDLRSAIKTEPADFSVMQEMAEKAAQKAEAGTGASGDAFGSGDTDGTSGANSTNPSSASAGNSRSTTGSGGGGSNSTSGGSTNGSGAGGSTASNDTFGDENLSGLDEELEDDSEEVLSISESVVSSTTPGLYGNQNELQIDISRIPRLDEFQSIQQSFQDMGLPEIPSDVKTVAYYIRRQQSSFSTGGDSTGSEQRFLEKSDGLGLVRRAIDRRVTQWAMENNDTDSLNLSGDLLAPEVIHLEFRYFDGLEWLLEWDSEESEGLPVAVEIILIIGSPEEAEELFSTGFSATDLTTQDHLYRLVVRLPNTPLAPEDEEESSDLEALLQ